MGRILRLSMSVALLAVVCGCGSTTLKAASTPASDAEESASLTQEIPDFYGLTEDGTVVRHSNGNWVTQPVDLAGDEKLRSVTWSHEPGDRPLVTVRTPDRNSCGDELRWLEADGSLSEPVATGSFASVSPDGNSLAYVALEPLNASDTHCNASELIVKDLVTGTSKSWNSTFPLEGKDYTLGQIETIPAWAPDSVHLVYGTQDGSLYRLDTSKQPEGATIRDAQALRLNGPSIVRPFWNDDTGHLFLLSPGNTSASIDQIDPNSGAVVKHVASVISRPIFAYGTSDNILMLGSLITDPDVAPSPPVDLSLINLIEGEEVELDQPVPALVQAS